MSVIYNGYYGMWNVDWDLVAYLDPDYAHKYLVRRLNKPEPKQESTVDKDALTMRQKAGEQIRNTYDRYIDTEELTEEDKQILDLMHCAKSVPRTETREMVRNYVQIERPPQPATPNEILGTDGPDDELFLIQEPGVLHISTTRRREKVKVRSKYRHLEYFPSRRHMEVHEACVAPFIPSVPLLPLPRNFQAGDSRAKVTDETEYAIHNHALLDDHSLMWYYRIIEDDTHIKLVAYQYALNKIHNTIRTTNVVGKNRLVFNKKTGNLYTITWEKTKKGIKHSPAKCRIRGISNQFMSISIMLHNFREPHIVKFVKSMCKAVAAKLGVPEEQLLQGSMISTYNGRIDMFVQKIMMLLWQSKIGQVIPWLDSNIFSAVVNIREGWQGYTPTYNGTNPDPLLFKKPNFGKGFFKALKKKPHPSTVFKQMLGEAYSATTQKMCYAIQEQHRFHNMIYFIELMFKHKRMYHFVANVAINDPLILNALLNASHELMFGARRDEYKALFTKYINALEAQSKHLHTDDDSRVITWELFRDTIQMAERYGISINANKLCHYDFVRGLHDRFVKFINRDAAVRREMANIEFVYFATPEKEYNGFVFKFLKNADELLDEGDTMKHCVGNYGHRCASGESIIFSMRRGNIGYMTLELNGDDPRLSIKQQYSRHDVTVNNPEVLKIVDEWHKDMRELHKNKKYTYGSQCQIVSRYIANITALGSAITEDMKKPVQNSIESDGALIDALGLREYVTRVLSNSGTLSDALEKANKKDHISFDAYGELQRMHPARIAPVPIELEADNG